MHLCCCCCISGDAAASLNPITIWMVLRVSAASAACLQQVLHLIAGPASTVVCASLQLVLYLCSWCCIYSCLCISAGGAVSLQLVLHPCSWCCIPAAGVPFLVLSFMHMISEKSLFAPTLFFCHLCMHSVGLQVRRDGKCCWTGTAPYQPAGRCMGARLWLDSWGLSPGGG